jgi:hypothetical protein
MPGFPYADHPPDDDMPPEDDVDHWTDAGCKCADCRSAIERLRDALGRFDALTTREQLWRQGAARD